MVKQELLDEKLNFEKTEQYKLSIQVSLNGFSFCCMDDNLKRFVALKEYSIDNPSSSFDDLILQLQPIIDGDDLFKQKFKEVKCMLVSPMYTLVPDVFFERDQVYNYLQPTIPFLENEVEIGYKSLSINSSVDIFAIPKGLAELLKIFHPNIEFYNHSIPQLIKQHEEQASATNLSMLIVDDMVSFCLVCNGELKISNTFTFESNTDLIYYTLLLLKESNVKPADVEVYVSGKIDKLSERYKEISRFLPNLAFDSVPKGYEYSYLFKFKAEHQFSNLFKLTECV